MKNIKDNSILKTFIRFVSFNILSMMGLSCYIFADTYFIANGIGKNALAAMNLAIPIFSTILAVGAMFGIGTGTYYSILKAQNKNHEADSVFTHSVIFAFILSLVSVISGLTIPDKISQLLGADNDTLKLTSDYLMIIMMFAPFFIINNILASMIRNDDAPKFAAVTMIIGSLSNVLLDYIFIYPLNMGIKGAAMATVASPLISITIAMLLFIAKGRNSFRFVKCKINFNIISKIISFGVSSFIAEMASAITILIFNNLILLYAGNTGVAAYGIVANLALVVTSMFTGIAQGIQPIASKRYGMNDKDGLKKIIKYALILTSAIFLIVYPLSYIFTDSLVSAFNNENNAELALFASEGIRIYFIGFIFAGINIVLASFLNSLNHTGKAFIISIMRGFAIIIPSALILSKFFEMNGIWISFVTAELITAIFSVISLLGKKVYSF